MLDTNVSILPRSFSDTHTIQLKIMRQMKNKNAFMYETIRPKVVHTAVKYLVEQELYKDEGIVISHDWLKGYSNERERILSSMMKIRNSIKMKSSTKILMMKTIGMNVTINQSIQVLPKHY